MNLKLYETEELLYALSVKHQSALEQLKESDQLLAIVGQENHELKNRKVDKSLSIELLSLAWLDDMYYHQRDRYRFASKSKPLWTYNTKKNRPKIDELIQICIEIGIMYQSSNKTLYPKVTRGEAKMMLQAHFDMKRTIDIEAIKEK